MPTDDPYVVAPGLLPAPFSAEEIRAGCPEGRTLRLRVTAPDETSYFRKSRYTACDAEGVTIDTWRVDEHGLPVGEIHSERSTWQELQENASFPADQTVVENTQVVLAMGTYPCRVYTVGGPSGPRFWFVDSFPGMPVRYEIPTETGTEVTEVVRDLTP